MRRLQLFVFLLAVSASAQDPRAAFDAAMTKMQEAGGLAEQGKFGPANELMSRAYLEIDRAIAMAPGDIELRARRGLVYGKLPQFLGKSEIADEDLRFVRAHSEYGGLPEDLRRQVAERLATRAGKSPDRFARIPPTTSPIIAAASISWAQGRSDSVPEAMERVVQAIDGYPGLLGTHMVSSVDRPGMYIVFTWWKDKEVLNEWFHGDLHQSWVRQRGRAVTNPGAANPELVPTQVAMEVFAGLPRGMQINGGFTPKGVFHSPRKLK